MLLGRLSIRFAACGKIFVYSANVFELFGLWIKSLFLIDSALGCIYGGPFGGGKL